MRSGAFSAKELPRRTHLAKAADAVLVQRRREAPLGDVVATVQLEANADCDNRICSLQRRAWLHGVKKLRVEIVKQKGKA